MKQAPPVAPDWLTPEFFALLDVVFIWIPLGYVFLMAPMFLYVDKHYMQPENWKKYRVVVLKDTIPARLKLIYDFSTWFGGLGLLGLVLYVTLVRRALAAMLWGSYG